MSSGADCKRRLQVELNLQLLFTDCVTGNWWEVSPNMSRFTITSSEWNTVKCCCKSVIGWSVNRRLRRRSTADFGCVGRYVEWDVWHFNEDAGQKTTMLNLCVFCFCLACEETQQVCVWHVRRGFVARDDDVCVQCAQSVWNIHVPCSGSVACVLQCAGCERCFRPAAVWFSLQGQLGLNLNLSCNLAVTLMWDQQQFVSWPERADVETLSSITLSLHLRFSPGFLSKIYYVCNFLFQWVSDSCLRVSQPHASPSTWIILSEIISAQWICVNQRKLQIHSFSHRVHRCVSPVRVLTASSRY